MDTKKRAIILDMDETLEHGTFKSYYIKNAEGAVMTLRPRLDELIKKIKVAKEQGIHIILCTTAHDHWVKRFFALKPEFKEIFNTIYTRDNMKDWNPTGRCQKPVETFGYDSILFIDDNMAERDRLQKLYDNNQLPLHTDITYFSGFGFGESSSLFDMLGYKKVSIQNPDIAQKLEQYLATERDNPGCNIMCSVIDTFMNKAFTPGFTVADEEYFAEYAEFSNLQETLKEELELLAYEMEEQTGVELFGYTDGELKELKEYLSTDKKYPHEGIEVARPEVDPRKQLKVLIQTAKSTQGELEETQNLIKDAGIQQAKEI